MSAKIVFFLTQDQADALVQIADGCMDRVSSRTSASLSGKGLLTSRWNGVLTPLGETAIAVARRLASSATQNGESQ